jgi:hypothetical protein
MKTSKPRSLSRGNQRLDGPANKMTRVQELQLELIELVNRNNCNGKKVAKLLRDNRHLWHAVLMPSRHLDPLRDMEYGHWSADTLYILPNEGQEENLEKLAKQFRADEVNWLGGEKALELLGFWKKGIEENPRLILTLWWD